MCANVASFPRLPRPARHLPPAPRPPLEKRLVRALRRSWAGAPSKDTAL